MLESVAVKKSSRRIVRAAEFKDAERIFRLIKQYPAQILPRPIGEIVQNIDRSLVCEINGHVVGTVSWQILPEIGAPRNPSVEIKSLAIQRNRRRSGIGTALVKSAIRRIRHLHPVQIIALTFTPEFFRQLGFREVSKKNLIHKIYAGCVNCTKYDSPFTCPEIAMAMDFAPRHP